MVPSIVLEVLRWAAALFLIGLLILVHELGHLLVARRCGVRVLGFSMGFGRKLLTWRRGETEYALSAVPLGGYVRMAGEQRSEHASQPWEYLSKSVGTRAWIVAAGPLVNYVMALVSLWTMFITGYPTQLPVVGAVVEDLPAQVAGIQPGDHIQAVDGQPVRTWDDMAQLIVASPDRVIVFRIERDGTVQELSVTPRAVEVTDPFGRRKTVGRAGIGSSGKVLLERVGPLAAVGRTIRMHNEFLAQNFFGLWLMFTGQVSVRDALGGPIAIAYLTSEAVRHGLPSTLNFIGIISLCLAVFNLFPIPILDGGHLLFLALEKLRGRPVSLRVQERSTQVGFALLLMLALFVCVNDLQRFGLVDKVADWFRR